MDHHFAEEMDWILNRMIEDAVHFLVTMTPTLKHYSTDLLLDTIFVPRLIAKQMLLAVVLETGRFAISATYDTLIQGWLVKLFSSRARMVRQLTLDQFAATSQDEFFALAEQMDAITGAHDWRSDPNCPLYDKDRITNAMDTYLHLMRRHAVFDLMFLLRGNNLGRNQFGLQHKGLFSKAQAGTKLLVETYHNVLCAALDFVCDAPSSMSNQNNNINTSSSNEEEEDEDDIPTNVRLAFFNEVRHAYGRTGLLLSGGAALGFYHVGVVKALMENNLMPRVIGGSSAGSIVTAMVGTRTDEECVHDLFHMKGTHAPGHSGTVELEFFRPLIFANNNNDDDDKKYNNRRRGPGFRHVYRNTAGAFHDAKRTWQFLLVPIPLRQIGSAMYDVLTGNQRPMDLVKNDTEYFKAGIKKNCGNFTFQEAFDRTGRIINIIVSPKNASDPPRLLNYLTAPHVLVWSAAVASASVPGIFEADSLMVRDPDGIERYESSMMSSDGRKHAVKFSDGSFEQDLPMQQLGEMFNVNHFIISQVNPQAVLFGSYNHRVSVWSNPIKGLFDSLLRFLKHQTRSWLLNLMKFVGSRRFRPLYAQTRANIGTQILTQEYEGRECDISLIPWLHHRSLTSAFLHMLYNPTPNDFFEWMAAAERETWKYIPRIKCHIAEEIALDQCVQRLRNRLILESRHRRQREQLSKALTGSGNGHSHSHSSRSQMKNGLPSFYVSPSLTNLQKTAHKEDAIALANQYTGESEVRNDNNDNDVSPPVARDYTAPLKDNPSPNHVDVSSGWQGLGLRGNRSSGSLDRQVSHSSGLFFDEDGEVNPQEAHLEQGQGEISNAAARRRSSSGSLHARNNEDNDSYHPPSMASFYYQKSTSNDNLRAPSDANLERMNSGSALSRKGRSESISSQHENFF